MSLAYWQWLVLLSLVFLGLERLWPRDPAQLPLRPGWTTDLLYLVWNGHWLGVVLAVLSRPAVERIQQGLVEAGVWPMVAARVAEPWPLWLQFLVALVVLDFIQWCIHWMLHRVPWLWEFHKVHHSIRHMDWAGSLRFHWMEILVYRTLQYLPLVWFGFHGGVLMALAVFGTAMGHFNHANLRWNMGPLRYVLNHPAMHIWHHVHPDHGPMHRNFGINLSVWDWLFGTAWLPDHDPVELGFEDIATFPRTLPGQLLWPLRLRHRPPPQAPCPAGTIGPRES
jgi:sterol desaturase/sphingolipid hydroxylase (fatty acid hydroxylase superfamily)